MIYRLIIFFIFYFGKLTIGLGQHHEPKLVFPEKPFYDYNCTHFLSEELIITPYHNSARIYNYDSKSLVLLETILLDSDPISIDVNDKFIYIVDWNKNLYIINKVDYSNIQKFHLDKIPNAVKVFDNYLFVLSDSTCSFYQENIFVKTLNFKSRIVGLSAKENVVEYFTSNGIFNGIINDSLEKKTSKKLHKLKNNKLINEDIFQIYNSTNNELYHAKMDSIIIIPKSSENVVTVKSKGNELYILDSSNVLSFFNIKNKSLKTLSNGVLKFEISDSFLYVLCQKTIKVFDLNTFLLSDEKIIPKCYDVRSLSILSGNVLITYSDLSFIFFSAKDKKWCRVNEKSGFKANLLFDEKQLICSGDSHIFRYDFMTNKSSIISNLYTFTYKKTDELLFYGSEITEQVDSILINLINKHDPLNSTSVERVEVFDSCKVIHFYNNKLVIKTNSSERIIEDVRHISKISKCEIVYQQSDKIFLLNLENKNELQISFNKDLLSMVISLIDSSILTLFNNGSGVRIFLNSEEKTVNFSFSEDYSLSSVFKDDANTVFLTTWNGDLIKFIDSSNCFQVINTDKYPLFCGAYNKNCNMIAIADLQGRTKFLSCKNYKEVFSIFNINDFDKLIVDSSGRFDGTQGAIDNLYLTCGHEIIDLAQVKDSLWVPGLVEKIMNGDLILINDHTAPKLNELNICELTPLIEELENGDNGLFRYRITPRKGGLGETEVYINENLTYVFKPEQLEKQREQNNDIYYLSIHSDSLQEFLTGENGAINPILVKSKVKGSGIYSRGATSKLIKQTNKEKPKFYGLFIGVNDYGNPTKEFSELRYRNLDFAAKDANDLAHAVEATARNLFKDDCYTYNLTGTGNAENIPTKANIQKALKEIGEKAKASDILYIFFAGHGDIPEDNGEKEIRFILHNADKRNLKTSSFGVDELSDWCHPQNIKAQKRIFVFDACHSGQIINQTMAFNVRGDDDAARVRQLDKLKDKNGMMILAASADNESAYEDETLNQGVLTYYLLQAIKEAEDTTLLVRQWFDKAIDGVIEYSRANGNKQEPNSFGDGRFEIGNVTEQVRSIIDISCPKTRIGMCEFMSFGSAEEKYPTLKNELSNILKISSGRGDFVLSKNIEKAYRISGVFTLEKNKIFVQYEIKKGDQILSTIKLPIFKKNASEKEIIETVSQSIQSEIERIDKHDEKCKKKNELNH